jgi:hypothetical protein
MYNHAYGLYYSGRTSEAREELEGAKAVAANTTESRHKIIVAALDNIKVRGVVNVEHRGSIKVRGVVNVEHCACGSIKVRGVAM